VATYVGLLIGLAWPARARILPGFWLRDRASPAIIPLAGSPPAPPCRRCWWFLADQWDAIPLSASHPCLLWIMHRRTSRVFLGGARESKDRTLGGPAGRTLERTNNRIVANPGPVSIWVEAIQGQVEG